MFAVGLSGLTGEGSTTDSETSMTVANDLAVRRALEAAGVEFSMRMGAGPECASAKAIVRSHDLQCAVPEMDLNEPL